MQEDESRPPYAPNPVLGELTALEARLRRDFAGRAAVERDEIAGGLATWRVKPVNPRSLPVQWIAMVDELLLFAGGLSRGGDWQLDATPEDVEFIEAVVRAVAAGQVIETSAFARSRVDVSLADGRVAHETGYEGCLSGFLPLPGWQRWGTVTRYEPYG